MLAGRRPMKRYPDIFFSMPELVEAIQQWEQSGIPRQRFRDILQLLDGRAKQHRIQRRPTEGIPFFNWAISWAKDQVISSLNEETKLKFNRERA